MNNKKFKEVCVSLSTLGSPVGDLCYDMLSSDDVPWDSTIENIFHYLYKMRDIHGDHLTEPIRELKKIWGCGYESNKLLKNYFIYYDER